MAQLPRLSTLQNRVNSGPGERQSFAVIVIAGVTPRPGAWEVHVQGEVPQELVSDAGVGLDRP